MKEVEPLEGAIILHGNIEHQEMADSIIRLMNGNLDVVLSDSCSSNWWDMGSGPYQTNLSFTLRF